MRMQKWLLAIALVAGCKNDSAPAKQAPPAVDCSLLGDTAKSNWVAAAKEMAKIGAPCSAHVEPVIAAMIAAMEAKTYGDAHHAATKELLDHVPLSPDQNERVLAATAKLEAQATGPQVEQVREVRNKCIHNRDRKPPPAPK